MKRLSKQTSSRHIMTEDELYQILYHADAETVRQLCQINKTARALCHQNKWQAKFEAEGLPSFEKKYTLIDYLTMSQLKQEAEEMLQVMSLHQNVYLIYIYPDNTVAYENIRFTPKWVRIHCMIKQSYCNFIKSLMKSIHNTVDIRDNEPHGVSYRKSVLLREQYKNKKSQERLDLYNRLGLEDLF